MFLLIDLCYDVKCLPVPKYIENYANVKNA